MPPSPNRDAPRREDTEISVSLQDLMRFLLRGLLLAGALAVAAGFLAYQLSQRQEPEYRAEATVLAARSSGEFTQFGLSSVTAPPVDASAYQAAAQSDRVLVDALAQLGESEPSEGQIRSLRGKISVSFEEGTRDSTLLRVEAHGPSPDVASDRANAVAEALVTWDRRRARESLSRVIGTLEEQINALSEQIRSLQTLDDAEAQTQADGLIRLRAEQQQQLAYARALIASAEGRLSVLQPAGTTPRQVAPRPALNAVIAALLAIAVGYGLLLLRSAFTNRLRSVEDIAATSGLPVLAQFPKASRNEALLREAGGYLRTNLLAATADAHPKVFMITSAHSMEGKTTVAAQLAEGLVRQGYRTLLVDADLRSPAVAHRYPVARGRAEQVTTRAWLTDPETARGTVRIAIGDSGHLHVVPQFDHAADAPELLGRGFRRALQSWEERFDVIVVDTPPVLAVSDPLTIAPLCTGTVLVVDQQRTDRRTLLNATELLERLGVRLLGIVANHDDGSRTAPVYGHGQPEPPPRVAPRPVTSQATVTELPRRRN